MRDSFKRKTQAFKEICQNFACAMRLYTVNSKGSLRVFLGYFFDKKTLMKGTLIKKGSFTTKKPKLRFFVEKKTKRKVFCRQKYLIKGYFP